MLRIIKVSIEINVNVWVLMTSYLIDVKLNLTANGHPLYFDNQATTPTDPRYSNSINNC